MLNLQILIVFKRVQLLLQSDHFFLKRLFLLVGLGAGRFFGAAFNGTDHLLMLAVGFLELLLLDLHTLQVTVTFVCDANFKLFLFALITLFEL